MRTLTVFGAAASVAVQMALLVAVGLSDKSLPSFVVMLWTISTIGAALALVDVCERFWE